MSDDVEFFLHASDRIRALAAESGQDPFAYLRDGVYGDSDDGTVRVWVDPLGRVRRSWISPDSIREDDEERLAKAFTQAARAAAARMADVVSPASLQRRIAELEGDTGGRPVRRETDDDMPVIRTTGW